MSVFSPVIPNTINKISFCFQQLRPISLVTVQSARPIIADADVSDKEQGNENEIESDEPKEKVTRRFPH